MTSSDTTTTAGPTYAGAVSRLAAYLVDHVAVSVLYSIGVATLALIAEVVAGADIDLSSSLPAGVALGAWWLAYFTVSWATSGATPGMGLMGVRVVRLGGTPVGVGRAFLRALVFPLSMALFGLGFVGILVQRERRALHDLIAGTAVVYTSPGITAAGRGPMSTTEGLSATAEA